MLLSPGKKMAAVPDAFLNNLHGTIGCCQELEQAVANRKHSLRWERRGETKTAAKFGDVLDGPPLLAVQTPQG